MVHYIALHLCIELLLHEINLNDTIPDSTNQCQQKLCLHAPPSPYQFRSLCYLQYIYMHVRGASGDMKCETA